LRKNFEKLEPVTNQNIFIPCHKLEKVHKNNFNISKEIQTCMDGMKFLMKIRKNFTTTTQKQKKLLGRKKNKFLIISTGVTQNLDLKTKKNNNCSKKNKENSTNNN
jgi:tRNA A37 threonylcarbamoyltransferase TsaD